MMRLNMRFMARVWGKPVTFTVPGGGGDYNDRGRWVPGSSDPVTVTATILPLTSLDLQFYEAGTFTTEDVKVLVQGDTELPIGTRFVHEGAMFEIRPGRDYSDIAGLRRYEAKRLRAVTP